MRFHFDAVPVKIGKNYIIKMPSNVSKHIEEEMTIKVTVEVEKKDTDSEIVEKSKLLDNIYKWMSETSALYPDKSFRASIRTISNALKIDAEQAALYLSILEADERITSEETQTGILYKIKY